MRCLVRSFLLLALFLRYHVSVSAVITGLHSTKMFNCQLSIASPKNTNTNLMWPYKQAINCLSVFIIVALKLFKCVLKPFQGPCNLDIVTCVKYLVHMLKAVCSELFFCCCCEGGLYVYVLITCKHVKGVVGTEVRKHSYLPSSFRLFSKLLTLGTGN